MSVIIPQRMIAPLFEYSFFPDIDHRIQTRIISNGVEKTRAATKPNAQITAISGAFQNKIAEFKFEPLGIDDYTRRTAAGGANTRRPTSLLHPRPL
jgi:hypothetical protein